MTVVTQIIDKNFNDDIQCNDLLIQLVAQTLISH